MGLWSRVQWLLQRENRRETPRYRIALPLTISHPRLDAPLHAHTVDANLTAVGLYCDPRPPIGAMVELELQLPDDDQPLVGLAQVIRCEPCHDRRGEHRVALAFAQLSALEEQRLRAILTTHGTPL